MVAWCVVAGEHPFYLSSLLSVSRRQENIAQTLNSVLLSLLTLGNLIQGDVLDWAASILR